MGKDFKQTLPYISVEDPESAIVQRRKDTRVRIPAVIDSNLSAQVLRTPAVQIKPIARSTRNVAGAMRETTRVESGAIFIMDKGCIAVPINTTIAGAEEIVFDSEFAGNGTLIVTGVGFEGGVRVALNGTELKTLSDTDLTNPINYEIQVSNLVAGFNSFKIWSTTSDSGELQLLEVWRNFTIEAVAKFLSITATTQVFRYDDLDVLIEPTQIDFTAEQSGSTATVSWVTQKWNGSAWVNTATNRVSPTTGLSTTMTEAAFAAEGQIMLRVLATFTDVDLFGAAMGIFKVNDGGAGLSVAELSIYRRATSTPATPTGGSYNFTTQVLTPPTSWFSAVPAGNNPVYISRGVAAVNGTTGVDSSITWSVPVEALREGDAVDIVFKRSATQPATPSPSSGTPTGWFTDVNSVPGGADPIWSSVGTRANAGQNWTWQTPVQIEGQDGVAGIVTALTNPSHVVSAAFGGGGYSLTGAGGTHQVWDGQNDETVNDPDTFHAVVAPATKNGLTMSVIQTGGSEGNYSLSGSNWTTTLETFILRATYLGVDYDKVYTIAKAVAGADGGCTLTALTNSDIEDNGGGTQSVAYRCDSDGDIYERITHGGAFVSKETWIGICGNTEYECRLVKNAGDNPTSGPALNTWFICSSDRTWVMERTIVGTFEGNFTFAIRRTSDNLIIQSVTVIMKALRVI